MARNKGHTPLFIYMNNCLVGTLHYVSNNHLTFQYDMQWLVSPEARSISLSLPLSEEIYRDEKVYPFFDNLLPDNSQIRERIQRRFKATSTHCFDLLSYIGRDCIGALQILTELINSTEKTIPLIQAEKISQSTIATLLKNYRLAPLGMAENNDFRISIAGAQEKTALLWYEDCWQLPRGMTPTSHIIKLPIGHIEHAGLDLRDSIENEWLCLRILSAYGLPVAKAELKQFAEVKTLVVTRFDRKWSEDRSVLWRLPQEDCCQALAVPSGLKYESDGGPSIVNIMELLQGSQSFASDRAQFMKTVFLFWVMGAIDGHSKNFSIFLHAGGQFSLTPIYDVMSAYPLAVKRQIEWKKLKMAMAVQGKNRHYLWNDIQLRHWLMMAKKCRFSEVHMQEIIETIFDNMDKVIAQVSQELPADFPVEIATSVFEGMKRIKKRCAQYRN